MVPMMPRPFSMLSRNVVTEAISSSRMARFTLTPLWILQASETMILIFMDICLWVDIVLWMMKGFKSDFFQWSTNITYWLANTMFFGYQNQSSVWWLGGDNIHVRGLAMAPSMEMVRRGIISSKAFRTILGGHKPSLFGTRQTPLLRGWDLCRVRCGMHFFFFFAFW